MRNIGGGAEDVKEWNPLNTVNASDITLRNVK